MQRSSYAPLTSEGILVNCTGIAIASLSLLIFYIATRWQFKRQPLPEDELLLADQLAEWIFHFFTSQFTQLKKKIVKLRNVCCILKKASKEPIEQRVGAYNVGVIPFSNISNTFYMLQQFEFVFHQLINVTSNFVIRLRIDCDAGWRYV